MELLTACDNPRAERHSSIGQHRNKLMVCVKGVWRPLSFDVIDYIDCDGIHSHRAVVTDGPDIGYNFPTCNKTYFVDKYLLYNHKKTELKALPHWFGEGFYKEHSDTLSFVNADNGSLGRRVKHKLTVGLDYILAKDTLDPVK